MLTARERNLFVALDAIDAVLDDTNISAAAAREQIFRIITQPGVVNALVDFHEEWVKGFGEDVVPTLYGESDNFFQATGTDRIANV